jgi:hypothetical protein
MPHQAEGLLAHKDLKVSKALQVLPVHRAMMVLPDLKDYREIPAHKATLAFKALLAPLDHKVI